MGEIRFRGGALHVDLGGQGAQGIDGAPRIADHVFLLLGRLRDLQRAFVGADHLGAQAVELADILVHQLLAIGDRVQQPVALSAHQGDVARAGFDAPLELGGGVFHPRHFGNGAGTALDQAGVCGAGLAGFEAQAFGRVARRAQPLLRVVERQFGGDLLLVQAGNGFARFRLPRIETGDLFPHAADFSGHEIGALLHTRFVFGGAPGLAFNADNFLFLAMHFARQAGNGRRGVRNHLLEARGLGQQLLEQLVRCGDPLAQLLDLALGGEDAARLRLVAAGHDVPAAEHVAVDRRHREVHGRRDTRCGLE